MRLQKTLAVSGLISGLLCGSAFAASSPVVHTVAGDVAGREKNGVDTYLGLPFAAPPVGDLRWQPPMAPSSWPGVREATDFAPACPQVLNPAEGRPPWTPEYLIPGKTSEDCLFLNVWTPQAASSNKAPVLVWFHGGAMVEGSGSVPVYNGERFARQGIVVVTVNYRLGVLGFLAHPELTAEQGGASGNYALLDMVAALQWVRDNIAAFGGDPDRVTIAGQSAGAGAVNALSATPLAKGLFWRTITESGSQYWAKPFMKPLPDAEARGAAFAQSIGAADLRALHAMPADQLITLATKFAQSQGGFAMNLNPVSLPVEPNAAQFSSFNDTPVLAGFNADERSGMDDNYGRWTGTQLDALRDAQFTPLTQAAASLYPGDKDAGATGIRMYRDMSLIGTYEWALHRAQASKNPIYIYMFDHAEPGPAQSRYGTFHSSEIPYVFGNLNAPRPFTNIDRHVSEAMQSRWVAFIKGEAPNAKGLATWTAFDRGSPEVMKLGDKEKMAPVLPDDVRQFADRLIEARETGTSGSVR